MRDSYIVKTLGCKANFYDSQMIEAELRRRGWVPFGKEEAGAREADGSPRLCIVNSCTVTDEADRQTRKLASKLARIHPGTRVVVTGCAAEVDPERLQRSKGIHYVIGNRDKPALVKLILDRLGEPIGEMSLTEEQEQAEILGGASGYAEMLSRHPMDREWPMPDQAFGAPGRELGGHASKTRAFLKIQEGCNSFCTYCVIPYGRGPSRSLRPREVISRIQSLIESGVREVVITGTNIGDYGADWEGGPEELSRLFEMIFHETNLKRLRVSSLDPVEINDSLLSLMEREPRFCPHFHVSLQSPLSKILRLMKRKYGFTEVERCLRRIATLPAPSGGVFVGMDVITGFPGETDADFEQCVQALQALPWTKLHVFPYSERAGTPATRLPSSVRQEVRVERARALQSLSLERMQSVYQQVLSDSIAQGGAPLHGVLLEEPKRSSRGVSVGGYTSNYLRVELENGMTVHAPNEFVSVIPLELILDRASGEVSVLGKQEDSNSL